MQHKSRYVPLVRNLKIRTTIGFILVVLSATLAVTFFGKGRIEVIASITTFAWIIAVFLTDKYVHKYPQRYFTYLIASHLKAALIMALSLWIMGMIGGCLTVPHNVLWTGFIIFVFLDAFVSVFRRRDIPDKVNAAEVPSLYTENMTDNQDGDSDYTNGGLDSIDKQAIISRISSDLDKSLFEFIENNLPDLRGGIGDVLVLDDITTNNQSRSVPIGLIVGRKRVNDVLRLNQFLMFCVERITIGGYFVVRYLPLENVAMSLRERYPGLLYWPVFISHFIWYRAIPKIPWLDTLYFSSKIRWLDTLYLSLVKRRNRVLAKAELWGRLSFCGMRVIAESTGEGGEIYLIAQRVALPVQNKRPSYYPIVALEKVGLDGKIIRTHKIRTMFPFSEFLQKRIFEDHGLAPTGKFANDFRLTELGSFLRKYWLDELPQVFDWLRGEIKLVGMRATSRHFLSLYPKELYDLYIQIKPGLIPPIFDEATNGLEKIIEVEFTYLQSYCEKPIQTDVRYLIKTLTDIIFRGVRSK
jgi:lipopolysaccharide/colanic/teichoic acid biosynthesis glycosyltransferase